MRFTRSPMYKGGEVQMSEQTGIATSLLQRFRRYLPNIDNIPFDRVLKIIEVPTQQDYVYDVSYLSRHKVPAKDIVSFMQRLKCAPLA